MSKTLRPETKKRGRTPGSQNLTTVSGVIRAIIATIREVRSGKSSHADGRSLIWMYAQLRDTLALGIIEKRIAGLEGEGHHFDDRIDDPIERHLH